MNRLVKISLLALISIFAGFFLLSAEELSVVTINAWPAIDTRGFFSCKEYESANDRMFRTEILTSGLKELDADIIVLNGVNPADELSAEIAAKLEMNRETWVSRSGLRVGTVSLPINLNSGDTILTSKELTSKPVGRISMNSLIAAGEVTFMSKNGVQVFGDRITVDGSDLYLFSVVWTESLFNDEKSLRAMTQAYISGSVSPDEFIRLVDSAVKGSELRLEQAAETLSFINSISGESPVLIMGSLNALPESRELGIFRDAGFSDVFELAGKGRGYTINTDENGNFAKIPDDDPAGAVRTLSGRYRADYILARGKALRPVSAEVVLNKPVYGVYPSNRYGLKAVIDFRR